MAVLDTAISFTAADSRVKPANDEAPWRLSIQEIGDRRHHPDLLVDLLLRPVVGNLDGRVYFEDALVRVLNVADFGPGFLCEFLRCLACALRGFREHFTFEPAYAGEDEGWSGIIAVRRKHYAGFEKLAGGACGGRKLLHVA